ncbi:MAG TPA: exodeoxyribonuclease I [Candidatus Saccharimonadales bacterium]|nr:exodeoxyribonuclease I [Candidatus Saccharimonadales bacterium]
MKTTSTPTFFFYDLETSGLDPRLHRIMQFAGQRTDLELRPIGEPVNILVSLSDEVLPDPGAILVTGITPQKTREEGYSEAEFLKILHDKVVTPGTTIVGFNSVRFDDEFMRFVLYRNFYDPYEWQWKDNCSRWDMLDVVRMTRALRPEGIEWPVDDQGNPTNRLELITARNGLAHENAHDALSDVFALIDVARLIKTKQPKLFTYLLDCRTKHAVGDVVSLENPQPFVYTSGRYPKEHLHTTVAYPVAEGSRPGTAIVYDLRHDPNDWKNASIAEMKQARFATREQRLAENFKPLPAKELAFNKCPAIAPLGVLDEPARERLGIDLAVIERNLKTLRTSGLAERLSEVFARDGAWPKAADVDASLYDGFIGDQDKTLMSAIRASDAKALINFKPEFRDARLTELLLRYKARNFPQSLSDSEREAWEAYRTERLQTDLPKFIAQLSRIASQTTEEQHHFLLRELQLWAESVAPSE